MSRTSGEVLSQEFLQIRAKILEIAAFYDRLSEAEPSSLDGRQMSLLQHGCEVLTDKGDDKAARVQLLFSREYDDQWRTQFGI